MSLEKANSINYNEDFAVKEPFPEIKPYIFSDDIIYILKDGYVGRKSEFTSQNQYKYQSFVLMYNDKTNNIGHTMRRISYDETFHSEILAEKMTLSDSDPRLCTFIDNNPNICQYWSGHFVCYKKMVEDIMRENIILETGAIEYYETLYPLTEDENLKELITRILKDERSHLAYFKAVLEAICDNEI